MRNLINGDKNNQDTKVVIIEKIFANYRKPIYDLLADQVKLLVLHGKNNSGIEMASTEYSKRIPSIQYSKKETALILFPLLQIFKFKPQIVVMDFALGIINLPIIIFICKLMGIKCAFWSHCYDRSIGFTPESRLADKYRLMLMRWVDSIIVYSKGDKNVLKPYLTKPKIFIAPNTLDTTATFRIRKKLELEGKSRIKKRLKVSHEMNLIFIGRIIPSKNPQLLIDLYDLLKDKYKIALGIHFIGDGPLLTQIKHLVKEKSIENDFYFHGSIYDNIKNGELLFISDLMVMPGAAGLSVNHAFCFNCPVLTFKNINGFPAHGPEVEYVIHNKTGFLLANHTLEEMAVTINDYLKNKGVQNEIKRNLKNTVENTFPIEKMLEGLLECFEYLNAEKKIKI